MNYSVSMPAADNPATTSLQRNLHPATLQILPRPRNLLIYGQVVCLCILTFGGVICVLFGGFPFYEELAYLLSYFPFVRFSFIKPVASFLMHSDMLKCFSTCCEAFPLARHFPFFLIHFSVFDGSVL